MWLSNDYGKLKHLKVESVSGKKTIYCEPVLAVYVTVKPHRAGSSSILPPSLLNSSQGEGHQNPSCFLSPPLGGAGERAQWGCQSVPDMLCVPLTEPSCLKGTWHPAGTCCALGSHGKNSWGLKSPVIAEWAPSLSYLLQQVFERPSFHQFSANQYPSKILPHRQKWCWHELALVGLTSR